ncbi:hypothetical protein PVAP13_5NG584850 [Panicum virgatum]|uniref:Reverse transcriptase zinc-binding domain-containing protein n=1 Tax=Panicum virgatum TaxID=38727 RepID=A0A8T0S706_PANVG|nr:hypothetical protein PVAP13_5NG584850 [Panicum virgatum]
MEIPCDEIDRQLFNASTTITIGDGSKAHFWQSAWLEGQAPKDLAPNLFASSKKKRLSVRVAIQDNSWVRNIRIPLLTSQQHFVEFVNLWTRLQSVELPYQNRLWTADRLERRGWPNQKKCPLCRHTDESALYLFVQCRYTGRLWTELGASVPAAAANMASWDTSATMRSLLLLISWEIWNERNGRIFRHKESSLLTLLAKIKEEARAWRLARAKCLSELWPGD